MYPILFEFQNFVLSSWHGFFFLAAVVAFFLTLKLTEGVLGDLDARLLYILTLFGGYLGSRLTSVFIDQEIFDLQEIGRELLRLGPMTSFGGLMGGFLSGSVFVLLRFPERRAAVYAILFDRLVKVGVLAIGIGRIGCFLNGDDYGVAVSSQDNPPWWAVKFPNHGDGAEYLVPVQLIEFALCLAIYVLFRFWEKRVEIAIAGTSKFYRFLSRPGSQGVLVAGSYAICRFFIEYLRDDPRGGLSYAGAQISPAQVWSLGVLLAAILFLYYRERPEQHVVHL